MVEETLIDQYLLKNKQKKPRPFKGAGLFLKTAGKE